ncbi:hypothetical protein K0U83_16560 [bacterium]|nr:hypothetical protein [bacterium]
MSVIVRDLGAQRLVTAVTDKSPNVVDVGIIGDTAGTATPDGMTVGALAEIHEFGLGVPQRSFLRAWADADRAKIDKAWGALLRRVLKGDLTTDQALEQFGLWAQGQVQAFIADGRVQPPLDQRTIDAKGSSTPLIDTGQLRSSITYEVRTP